MEAWAQGGRAGRNHRGWAGAFNETTAKRHPFAAFGFPRTYADELLKLPRYTPDPRMPASACWGARAQLRRACSIELATPDLSKLCLNFERRRERTASNVQRTASNERSTPDGNVNRRGVYRTWYRTRPTSNATVRRYLGTGHSVAGTSE
jgi:hypothetical protein